MSSFTNRHRAKQLLDFNGLKWGNIRPTDMDLSVEFQGRTFIFGEIKGMGRDITAGQRYHLEALVKGLRKGGCTAYAFLAHHSEADAKKDVFVADCGVTKVYNGVQWFTPEQETVWELMNAIHKEHKEGEPHVKTG